MKRLFPLAVLLSLVSTAVHAETSRVGVTKRGDKIEVIVDYPEGAGPFPVLVLAPGMGYSARQPVLEAISSAATAKGVAVYRLNWAYTARPEGKPSTDRSAELEDLNTVIDLAAADPSIDGSRIALGGKSLGSFVAWRAWQGHPAVKVSVELTPLCSKFTAPVTDFAGYYTDIARETRPSLWLLGDADAVCTPKTLYGLLASVPSALRIVVLSGNHSLESGTQADPVRSKETIDLAAEVVADYVSTQLNAR